MIKSLLRLVSVCGLLVLLLAYLPACSSLLFYPSREVPFTPQRADLEYRDLQLRTADGLRLAAWWLPAKAGVPVKGTVLQLHGNGGNMAWHLGATYWLPEQGYQVLMLDYRGYGKSQGEPGLPEVFQDLDAAFLWLDQAPEVQGKPLILLGQSLGGALGLHYLAEHPQRQTELHGIVLDGVPASYRSVARYMLDSAWLTWPMQVPLSWLVPDQESAIYAMPKINQAPLLIFHSLDDSLVPVQNGLALYKAAPGPKVLQLTRGEHIGTFGEAFWRDIMLRFLDDPQQFTGLRRLAEIPNLATPEPTN